MSDFTPTHMAILERFVTNGFATVAFPFYVSAIGVRRQSFAALLMPAGEAALKLMGEPCYVIGSNLAVQAWRQGREVFECKEKSVGATAELLHEVEKFASDVAQLLAR